MPYMEGLVGRSEEEKEEEEEERLGEERRV